MNDTSLEAFMVHVMYWRTEYVWLAYEEVDVNVEWKDSRIYTSIWKENLKAIIVYCLWN